MIRSISLSLSEILQQLIEKGYQLADLDYSPRVDENLPHDWHLDTVKKVINDEHSNTLSIVIAVSSGSRSTKLVFVEPLDTQQVSNFSPMNLLRRLFPKK
jgi:hypothetical protein